MERPTGILNYGSGFKTQNLSGGWLLAHCVMCKVINCSDKNVQLKQVGPLWQFFNVTFEHLIIAPWCDALIYGSGRNGSTTWNVIYEAMGGEEISHGLEFQPSGAAGYRTERQTPLFLHLASWFQTWRKINFMSYNRGRLLHSVSPRNTRVLQLTLLLYPDSDMECLASLQQPLGYKRERT
jgi:hypothetical protein